jgi:alkyl hydroperoxide reductase subunit D
MSIKEIRQSLSDYAKDIKINLGNVLDEEGSEGLNEKQIAGIAISSAYATKNEKLIQGLLNEYKETFNDVELSAIKGATAIMGMNNIYYRFIHLVSDEDYSKLPAGLRMNIIGNPGIEKIDFELYSLAVSAINGCGMCMDAHVGVVQKAGVSKQGVQSTIRIAAVINATAQALTIDTVSHI